LTFRVRAALILGSGLGAAAGQIKIEKEIPAVDLFGTGGGGVAGHAGRVVVGTLEGIGLIAFLGRVHLYEGRPAADLMLPVLLSHLLHARVLLLTNAAGGLQPEMRPGDLMVISDQINLTGRVVSTPAYAAGVSGAPSSGLSRAGGSGGRNTATTVTPMAEAWGRARGFNLTRRDLYDPLLADALVRSAFTAGVKAHRGVYAGGLGPSYETAAEIGMLRRFGADAVGMSTVLEALAGWQLGMAVGGISVITNLATGMSASKLSHEEVTAGADIASKNVRALLGVLFSGGEIERVESGLERSD
jgi:purine nucleoside phosphorylase